MLISFLSGPLSVALVIAAFFFMIWPGYAVLHLLGLGYSRWPWAIFAGPAVTLALWIIVLSGSVWAGFTLQQTAMPVWATTFLLMTVGLGLGLSDWRKAKALVKINDPWIWLLAVACVAIPLLIMPATFRFGLVDFPNSTSADSWSYLAVADYLLTIPRGMEGGLSALHQYAAHLMGTRNATPAILGFLSIGLGDVKSSQAVVLFCLLVLFANAAALVAFAGTILNNARVTGEFLLIVGLGWPANIVLQGNFDQLLILPLLPAIAALALLAGAGHSTARAAIVISILAAASFYAYVELCLLGVLVAMSFIAVPTVSIRPFISRAVLVCGIALPTAAILTWPAFDALLAMLKSQYSITGTAVRPGEGYFPGLVSRLDWPGAVWAFGPEHSLRNAFIIGTGIGVFLLFMTIAGVWAQRRRWSAILALAVIAAAFVYFAYHQDYSYAAYKIVSVNFWLVGFFAVTGFSWLTRYLPNNSFSRRAIAVVLIAGLGTITGLRLVAASKVTHFIKNGIQQGNFREIQAVANMIGNEPTVLSVRDPFANEWAVFYLADTPMLIAPYRLHMAQPHVLPFMSRAKAADPSTIRYIVTEHNDLMRSRVAGARPIWEGLVYKLWAVDRPDWSVIAEIDSPNGLESDASNYWTWLGGPPAVFTIAAGRKGVSELVGMFYPGPQAPQNAEGIRVSVTDATGRHEFPITQIASRLPINLSAGIMTVTIKIESEPNPAISTTKRDPRALILRLTDFTVQNSARQY